MPSTHSSLNAHIIFSTKNRIRSITPEVREQLHAYLGGCLRQAGAVPVMIGGPEDHVHLLAGYRPRHAISDLVRDIKSASSEWMHDTMNASRFAWQEGYGAFTVCRSEIESVSRYIANQFEHHRNVTFQEEYRRFLEEFDIDFKEEYLW